MVRKYNKRELSKAKLQIQDNSSLLDKIKYRTKDILSRKATWIATGCAVLDNLNTRIYLNSPSDEMNQVARSLIEQYGVDNGLTISAAVVIPPMLAGVYFIGEMIQRKASEKDSEPILKKIFCGDLSEYLMYNLAAGSSVAAAGWTLKEFVGDGLIGQAIYGCLSSFFFLDMIRISLAVRKLDKESREQGSSHCSID